MNSFSILVKATSLLAWAVAVRSSPIDWTYLDDNDSLLLTRQTAVDPSVFVCQNYHWIEPCIVLPMAAEEDEQQQFWMAPAPGGPGPFRTGNYTVGSWGPSDGVLTWWEDNQGAESDVLGFPGTGSVPDAWKNDIWTWYAVWYQQDG